MDNEKNNADYIDEEIEMKNLTPFKMFTLTKFPFIEETFDALNNYQFLSKIVEYLNDVIKNNNNVTENTKNLYNAYLSLQIHVNDYFEKLNVQDEINYKLDMMTNNGTIAKMIDEQYDLTPKPADSISDMTDVDSIYVNTTDGNWYYYNGSEWVVGGVFQGVAIKDGSVTAEKTNFVEIKHNNHFKVFETDPSWHGIEFDGNIETGKILINGTCIENTNFNISNGIDYFIEPGTYIVDLNVLSGSLSGSVGISMYGVNENGTSITLLNVGSETLPKTINITEKIKITSVKMWVTTDKVFNNLLIYPQIQKGGTIIKTYPHRMYDFKNSGESNENTNNSLIKLLVPSNIRYLPNRELSFYYDNILYNGINKEMISHQTYNNINTLDDCFRFNKSDVKTYYEKLIFNTFDRIQYSKNINLIGVAENSGNGVTKKCLFIGDSLTDLGFYTQELLNLFENDVMNIELLGTRGSGLNKHEGRSNWSAYSYTHESNYTNLPNPFFNTTTNQFDFTKYMNDNNYSTVDIVSIALGTNDRGVIGSNENDFKNNLQTMINSIKSFNSNIKILILLPPPISYVGKDSYHWNMSIKLANKTIIDNFDNKENENIFIIASGLNIDPINDYKMTTTPINSRSSKTKTIVQDPVHPDVIGFEHIADMIYPILKHLGSL